MPKRSISKPTRKQEIVNAEKVSPIYANWAQVAVGPNDIRLVLGEVFENSESRQVVQVLGRIYFAPRVAKAVLKILANSVAQFEKVNGPIPPEAQPSSD